MRDWTRQQHQTRAKLWFSASLSVTERFANTTTVLINFLLLYCYQREPSRMDADLWQGSGHYFLRIRNRYFNGLNSMTDEDLTELVLWLRIMFSVVWSCLLAVFVAVKWPVREAVARGAGLLWLQWLQWRRRSAGRRLCVRGREARPTRGSGRARTCAGETTRRALGGLAPIGSARPPFLLRSL